MAGVLPSRTSLGFATLVREGGFPWAVVQSRRVPQLLSAACRRSLRVYAPASGRPIHLIQIGPDGCSIRRGLY